MPVNISFKATGKTNLLLNAGSAVARNYRRKLNRQVNDAAVEIRKSGLANWRRQLGSFAAKNNRGLVLKRASLNNLTARIFTKSLLWGWLRLHVYGLTLVRADGDYFRVTDPGVTFGDPEFHRVVEFNNGNLGVFDTTTDKKLATLTKQITYKKRASGLEYFVRIGPAIVKRHLQEIRLK